MLYHRCGQLTSSADKCGRTASHYTTTQHHRPSERGVNHNLGESDRRTVERGPTLANVGDESSDLRTHLSVTLLRHLEARGFAAACSTRCWHAAAQPCTMSTNAIESVTCRTGSCSSQLRVTEALLWRLGSHRKQCWHPCSNLHKDVLQDELCEAVHVVQTLLRTVAARVGTTTRPRHLQQADARYHSP
jgi:hypothetical protein